jgi:hypothetical protein
MAKKTNGYTYEENGKWYARFTFTDSTGRCRNIKRRAGSKSQARELLRRLLIELDTHGSKSVQSSNMTFNGLADFLPNIICALRNL